MSEDLYKSLVRRVEELERKQKRSTIANNLEASAIGRGGLRVFDGGVITIENGGLKVTGTISGSGAIDWTGTFKNTGKSTFDGDVEINKTLLVLAATTLRGLLALESDMTVKAGGKIVVEGVPQLEIGPLDGGAGFRMGDVKFKTVPFGGRLGTDQYASMYATGAAFMGSTDLARGVTVDANQTSLVGPVSLSDLPNAPASAQLISVGYDTVSKRLYRMPGGGEGGTFPGGGGNDSFQWPFSLSTVTSEFGPRDIGYHNGIDFGVPAGTTVPSVGDGVIAQAGFMSDLGNYVRINHGTVNGRQLMTGYAHFNQASPWVGRVGDPIKLGERVGNVGNTGYSFGAHLHLEMWEDGVRINPRQWMSRYGS